MKLQIGQEFLVYGPYHYEKAKVVKAEKGRYTLDNNMGIDRDLNPTVPTTMKVEPFDENRWEFMVAKGELPKLVASLYTHRFTDEQFEYAHKKIKKLLEKLNSK